MTQRIQANIDEYGYPLQPDSKRLVRNSLVSGSKRILLAATYQGMSLVGNNLARRRRHQVRPALTPATFQPRRILVIRLDLIGDLVLSLTTVQALKRTYPDAEIDLLAVPSSAKVVAYHPALSEVITYDPNIWRRPKALLQLKNWREAFALRRRLRARRYDLAISVFGPWASLLTIWSGAQRSVGFAGESYPHFLTDPVPGQHWGPHDHQHEVDYCLELAQAAGATIEADDRIPHLPISPEISTSAEELLKKELAEQGIQRSEKALIACHVSSNNGQSKRWPIPYWSRLLDLLIREDGVTVAITGAPADLPLIASITERMSEKPLNLAGKTSLSELAAILQQADLMITGDSGPMHIAAAVGTPLIAIHGPTDPALSGPVSPKATVLRDDIWCSPCYTAKGPADCRFFTTQCMKNIPPELVRRTIYEKLPQLSPAQSEVAE